MRPWEFLKDADRRGALGAIGAFLTAIVVGLWAIFQAISDPAALRWRSECEREADKWYGLWEGKSGGETSVVYLLSRDGCELNLGFVNTHQGGTTTSGTIVGGISGNSLVGRVEDSGGVVYATISLVRKDGEFSGTYVITSDAVKSGSAAATQAWSGTRR